MGVLLHRQDFYPVVVRVVDEIQAHRLVFVAYAAHFLVEFPHFVVVAFHSQTQVAFVFSQFIGSLVVAQPGQFEQEARGIVGEVYQDK